jgi:hypothetical protein
MMLPDFPTQKARLLRFWTAYLRRKEREYLGYFATAPSYTHHEGDRWTIQREDGTSSESTYREIEVEMSIATDEVPNLTPDRIAKKLDSVAEKLAKQMHQGIMEGLNQAIDQAGTGVDAKGSPLTKELFLEMLDRMLLPFDKDGNLIPPTIMMHPRMWETHKEEVKSWEQDPEFRARHEEIIERKREEWRDRESCRKLVD